MAPLGLLLSILFVASPARGGEFGRLGVNYGVIADNLPSHGRSIQLARSLGAGAIKLYDANPDILSAMTNTNLAASIMVPDDLIATIGANASLAAADAWVLKNVVPFNSTVRIRYLLVGNEILSDRSLAATAWPRLVPAMANIRRSLVARGLAHIKVGTTLAMDTLSAVRPPSAGAFRPDVAGPVLRPLLQFLKKTKSFYFVDLYPYFNWAADPKTIPLDYALFEANPRNYYVDPVTKLTYTNLFDEMLDAVAAAMARLGHGDVRIAVAETGWPNGGDYDQIGGNVRNAATYNRNLASRLAARPPPGTPARPGAKIPAFVFSLYNEDLKGGPGTERHWGMLYPNGTKVYDIDLSGRRPAASYAPLPAPTNDEPYRGPIWCVWRGGRLNATRIGAAVAYACGQGNGTCDEIRVGGSCYQPNMIGAHASYAFNSYWQQFREAGGTCYFDGLAVQTLHDPSHGSCKFRSLKQN